MFKVECVREISPSNTAQNKGVFYTGKYRNLFVEAGCSQQEVTENINKAFEQFFYGDQNSQTVYYPAGENENGEMAYISDINSNDVRSEGMSYGMMICVQLDKKKEFDALWNWAMTYMYHNDSGHPAYGYFAWSLKTNGEYEDQMPAPDGEEYFVMALYFASNRWGNGEGIYNYKAYADRLLSDMKNRETITGQTGLRTQSVGNIFSYEYKMIRFTPDMANSEHTDPSYHLPAFYELWALWGPEKDSNFWKEAAQVSRDFFQKASNPKTGLTPDYANFDGSPWACPWNPDAVNFRYDAWRTAMNWSVDWAWWEKDAGERELSDRIQSFFESQGISDYKSIYTLDGMPIGGDYSQGLVAMNAAASLAATNARAQKFVKELWNASIPVGQYRYYDGMLYMLALLHCSGEFKIWAPK
ncbi:MAG: xylanase [Sedimentisphaerales bacterium]|nr:xylanase [Sedimentisphaerales bacterium]